jgi:hypothetical protein
MAYYAGQLLYCIDAEHPLYGRRIKVATPLFEAEDGTPMICDIETGKTVELKQHQISVYAPTQSKEHSPGKSLPIT